MHREAPSHSYLQQVRKELLRQKEVQCRDIETEARKLEEEIKKFYFTHFSPFLSLSLSIHRFQSSTTWNVFPDRHEAQQHDRWAIENELRQHRARIDHRVISGADEEDDTIYRKPLHLVALCVR